MDIQFDRLILSLPQKKLASVLAAYILDQCWIIFSLWSVPIQIPERSYMLIVPPIVLIEIRKFCGRTERLCPYLKRRIINLFMPNIVGVSFFVIISIMGYQDVKLFKPPEMFKSQPVVDFGIWMCNAIHWYAKIGFLSFLLIDYFISKSGIYDNNFGLNLIAGYIFAQALCGLLLLPGFLTGMWIAALRQLIMQNYSTENWVIVTMLLIFIAVIIRNRRNFRIVELGPDEDQIIEAPQNHQINLIL